MDRAMRKNSSARTENQCGEPTTEKPFPLSAAHTNHPWRIKSGRADARLGVIGASDGPACSHTFHAPPNAEGSFEEILGENFPIPM